MNDIQYKERFQSTHPRGVRLADFMSGRRNRKYFNPRTHEGCDPLPVAALIPRHYFNPRTHEGCDDTVVKDSTAANDFNPRTHEGCDPEWSVLTLYRIISIHAPTRGATHNGYQDQGRAGFQSTHPRGVRPRAMFTISGVPTISIHAPTRGATQLSSANARAIPFQSTHPRGVRHLIEGGEDNGGDYFNPRTHEGCDTDKTKLDEIQVVFQSTHPRGVRLLSVGLHKTL